MNSGGDEQKKAIERRKKVWGGEKARQEDNRSFKATSSRDPAESLWDLVEAHNKGNERKPTENRKKHRRRKQTDLRESRVEWTERVKKSERERETRQEVTERKQPRDNGTCGHR